jgi:ABC-type Fe3+-siderophore transport system permease subunit
MAGLEVPSWDPQTALLIGTILVEAFVLYVGYAGLERLVGPHLMRLLVGGDGSGQ